MLPEPVSPCESHCVRAMHEALTPAIVFLTTSVLAVVLTLYKPVDLEFSELHPHSPPLSQLSNRIICEFRLPRHGIFFSSPHSITASSSIYASYSMPAPSSRTSTSSTNTNSSGYNGYQESVGAQSIQVCFRAYFVESQLATGDVPTLVHNLLSSTKQLQEILRQWSLNQATETQVSDAYVQVGTEFNATIGAFAYHQIDLRYGQVRRVAFSQH